LAQVTENLPLGCTARAARRSINYWNGSCVGSIVHRRGGGNKKESFVDIKLLIFSALIALIAGFSHVGEPSRVRKQRISR
jgi:hypothetical protein